MTAVSSRRYSKSYLKGVTGRLAGPTRVEAGSNTFTMTLRVVGGDEKGSLKSEPQMGLDTKTY
jgi:hypothetical protein